MTGESPRRPVSVSDLTRAIRELLESRIGEVWVEGEISNLRVQSSGHCYFTLKDEESQISAVLFRGAAAQAPFKLADGLSVVAFGEVSVYAARGNYQIIVRRVIAQGAGSLQARFEELKRKLEAEGLFDPDRKRPIPALPETVVLVTSPTGAALRDMLNILARRAPQLRLFVLPVRVQGTEAAPEIAAALQRLAAWHASGAFRPDTIVLARGGGSLEDLWPFNEEIVARALAASPVPVLSGVGHETDFTIADFTADLRAPTPSAAAELLIPARDELLERIRGAARRLARSTETWLAQARLELRRLTASAAFREPRRVVETFQQRLDDLLERLDRAPRLFLAAKGHALELAIERLQSRSPARRLELAHARLRELGGRLDLLDPRRPLDRGYAIVRGPDGGLVRSAAQLPKGTRFTADFKDGGVQAEAL